jgi:iron complex transport system ATP-binding protein
MTAASILAADDVGWQFDGRRILDHVDLQVDRGECLVVVGPNGAGKTTLLRTLVGLLEPASGTVRLEGTDLARLSRRERARHLAYVPQIRPTRVPLTVEQMVLLGRYPYLSAFRGAPRASDFEAVARALEVVGIGALRERLLTELSGGEQQAVYVATALAQEAEVDPSRPEPPAGDRGAARGAQPSWREDRRGGDPRSQLRLAHRRSDSCSA